MQITRTSMLSGKKRTMDLPVTQEQLVRYYSGTLLQIAFPDLDASQREFIKTGITQDEWDEAFKEEQ